MDNAIINIELQKFNVTDAVIAAMSQEYSNLTISGIEDKDGYKKVHDARMIVSRKRIDVEKKRKELKEESLKFGRAVDAEAKRITAMLKPIEEHLIEEEEKINAEKERIKVEKQKALQLLIQKRSSQLYEYGATLREDLYFFDDNFLLNVLDIQTFNDEDFEKVLNFCKEKFFEHEAIKKEREEKARIEREEQQRAFREQMEAQEAERARLEAIKKEQEEKENKIKAELAAIEEQKKEIQRQKDLEQAKKEAAEKAIKEAKEKAEREAKEKIEAEKQAKIEAERQEALKPDKQKLADYADRIINVVPPVVESEEANSVVLETMAALKNIAISISTKSKNL